MKQNTLFEFDEENQKTNYTKKIKTPTYEPKNNKPHILELVDQSKSKRLINEINNSNLSNDEKKFLIEAAKRHNKFNYQKIADYYASSSKEMQNLMERSSLVIIDFNKAYQNGYIKLSHEVANQYFENHGEDK